MIQWGEGGHKSGFVDSILLLQFMVYKMVHEKTFGS